MGWRGLSGLRLSGCSIRMQLWLRTGQCPGTITIYPMEFKRTKRAAGTDTLQEGAMLLEGSVGRGDKGEDDT